ncbi:MAG: hypothetical protein FJZ01_23220 [Candidatus Sericytochromatia bacterium]|nr:hypothetical protein [Candidatus Tanganyikabacteria bacterium]
MSARNRSRVSATRKLSHAQLEELRRRVALRGGTRHVQGGALKLSVPRTSKED